MSAVTPKEIIEFWFGDALDSPESARKKSKFWYASDSKIDNEIRRRFESTLTAVHEGHHADWEASLEGTLALVIVLDQFSRNLYRGDARAYSGDELALEIADRAVQAKRDRQLPGLYRLFLYHPFHHSERLQDQDKAVKLFQDLEDKSPQSWREFFHGSTRYSLHHRETVVRFGRFPHRNKILGRSNTEEEQAFLNRDPRSFGQ
jgi:uncharacterized protein (DUF924 family)